MAAIDLNTLLELVGVLNDSTEKGSASDRFRNYLRSNVIQSADARAYIESALSRSGDQSNKALQDLINHLGFLLGFRVTFGRYRGVKGQVGFDGLWQSPTGWSIVVETKTTDVYTVRTDTLLGYMNSLVSDGRISGTDRAVGLYVYGRFDNHTSQLENAINVENRRNQLRVVSVPALLDLLQLKQEYGLAHDSVLDILVPAPIRIDPIVGLIRRVVAQEQERDAIGGALIQSPFEPDQPGNVDGDDSHPVTGRSIGMNGDDFTGKTVTAVRFRGKSYPASKWREAFEKVVYVLVDEDKQRFEQVAPTLVGRKRPYFATEPNLLRSAGPIPGTSLYFETNLSATYLTRLLWTLIEEMGYDREDLAFETAPEDGSQ